MPDKNATVSEPAWATNAETVAYAPAIGFGTQILSSSFALAQTFQASANQQQLNNLAALTLTMLSAESLLRNTGSAASTDIADIFELARQSRNAE